MLSKLDESKDKADPAQSTKTPEFKTQTNTGSQSTGDANSGATMALNATNVSESAPTTTNTTSAAVSSLSESSDDTTIV